jgi:hypothetical protein
MNLDTAHNVKARKTIKNIAPSLRIKIYDFNSKQLQSVVTQGWQIGCMAVVPDSDFYLASWEIIHQPSGFRMMSARSEHSCLLKINFQKERSWNGSQYWQTLSDPVSARIFASWLSGFAWGNPITKQNLQQVKDRILADFDINFI